MNTSDDQEEPKWRLGKVKFYDTDKEFGFARDLTISDYAENEDDVYIGASVSAPQELTDDAYIVFQKVPSSREPGTFRAQDVRHLLSHPEEIEPLIKDVASSSELEELRRYLQSDHASWQVGKVKFFDATKGFGFIRPLKSLDVLGGDDAYVNERNVDAKSLPDGKYVAFRVAPSRKPGEYQAVGVQTLTSFERVSTSFTEDLAFWILGGSNLRPNVSAMAHLVPQSEATEVRDLIEKVARGDEHRPERKRGTALRLLGKVLEKAEEKDLLPSEFTESIWKKYDEEVRRLVTQNVIPSRVEALLWVQGLVKTLDPEMIDALIDWALRKKTPDQNIDLSFGRQSSLVYKTTKPSEAIELTKIVNRLRPDELADCVVRHAEKVESDLGDKRKVTVSRLENYHKLLDTLRQERESEVTDALDAYAEAVRTYATAVRGLAQYSSERNLSDEQAFSLWRDKLIDEITYSEFFCGFTQVQSIEKRIHLLERLESERRRQFAVQRTTDLLRAREDSDEAQNETLSSWLEDVESYSETVESENETAKRTLRSRCETVLREKARKKTLVVLYGEGYLSSIPEDWLLKNAGEINRTDLEPVLERADSSTAERVLTARIDALSEIAETEETSIYHADFLPVTRKSQGSKYYLEARWVLAAAERSLTDSQREDFQSALTERVDVPTHVQLHQEGHLQVDPAHRIFEYMKDVTVGTIDTVQSWIEKNIVESDTFENVLETYVCDVRVENRETARCVQSAVRWLEEHTPSRLDPTNMSSGISRAIVRLTWWIDNEDDQLEKVDFDLSLLQRGLCWLSDEDQVTALRKVFYLHAKEHVTLTPDKLAACSSFQFEDANQPIDTEHSADTAPPLGLSAELIIQTICRVAETGEFPREGHLIEIVQYVTKDDPSQRVQLLDIFDRCEGRVDELEMGTSPYAGKVEEVTQNGRRKFIISFEYFEELVEDVKRLPGRQYDPDQKVWIVPAETEDQREATFQFARNHSFFIDLEDGKHWTNNEHMVEKPRKDPPHAVTYCEGRKAKRKDFETYDFWWCRNEKCYASCHGGHEESDWKSYTVEDFLRLLELQVAENTRHGTIEMEQYHRFLGWMNRFNQLIDRLYCRECGHILDASESSNYSYYRVTNFHCSNTSCPKYKEDVYLHHCLNPKCGSVIDSRDSEQCPNGWWICTNENCGACCSTKTLRRRRENRKEIGLSTSDYITRFIKEKKGHLEYGKHFCYKCGKEMEKYSIEQYRCPEGHVEYNLSEADFDRPHRS